MDSKKWFVLLHNRIIPSLLGECCASCHTAEVDGFDHDEIKDRRKFLTVCHGPGKFFVEGETWQLDKCTACTCRGINNACIPLDRGVFFME